MATDNSVPPATDSAHAPSFELCTKLNLAGCGVNSIPDLVRNYVNIEIKNAGHNYSLPLDPCYFDTIDMQWILSISDLSLLDLITADQVISDMPCEIYIQMPSEFLSDRNIPQIITDSYWFGSNGHCQANASRILDCSDPNRTILNYTTPQQLQSCFYPFVESKYQTPIKELFDAGFTNCGLSCDFYPYGGDIHNLDDFNFAASIIALFFGAAYFINVSLAFSKAFQQKKSKGLCELPLSFDIPIIIALWVLILSIILVIPSWFGKDYFACEEGSDAVVAHPLYETNLHCFIAGQLLLVSIQSIYLNCSLLSFSIWRSLTRPIKPLFGIRKIWYHAMVYVVVFGFYTSALTEEAFGANNVIGICGISIIGESGMKYLLGPFTVYMSTFIIFTSLTLYELRKHFHNQSTHNQTKKAQKAITHLAVRMMVYSLFVAGSMCCWLYIGVKFVFEGEEWRDNIQDNVGCVVDNELFGSNEECELILSIEDDVYWMQGIVILLISSASFVLSCTNARYNDYGKMTRKVTETTVSKLQKVASLPITPSILKHHASTASAASALEPSASHGTPVYIPQSTPQSLPSTLCMSQTSPSATLSVVPNN